MTSVDTASVLTRTARSASSRRAAHTILAMIRSSAVNVMNASAITISWPTLQTEIEAEERRREVIHEQAAEIIGESRAMDETEEAGEHRRYRRSPDGGRAVADDEILERRGEDRHGYQKLDQRSRKIQRAGDGERQRHGMSDGECRHHPHAFPPVPEPVDGGEGEQENDVVGAARSVMWRKPNVANAMRSDTGASSGGRQRGLRERTLRRAERRIERQRPAQQ